MEVSEELIETVLNQWSDRVLIKTTDSSLSYSEFFKTAASFLEILDTEPGERVFLCSNDQFFLISALWALWMRKSVAVPVNPSLPKERVWPLMKGCGSRLLLTSKERFQEVPHEIRVMEPDPLQNVVSSKIPFDFKILQPQEPASIIFTSGSTGLPKGAVLSLANFCFSALGANQQMKLIPGDRWLLSIPLFHVGGLGVMFRCLLSGATMVIPASKQSWEDQLRQHSITHLSLVPTQLQRMIDQENVFLLKPLKLILLGGAAQSSQLIGRAQSLGLRLMTSYGSTEMSSQVATARPKRIHQTWTACGGVLPYREVRLAEDGEIMVRGQTRFLGYLEIEPDSSDSGELKLKKPFDAEGWFASGDLGQWIGNPGSEPLLKMKGRKDSMFISGGENIHPQEIEERLMEFPGILQAIVVPVQDLEYGQRPVAFLKFNETDDPSSVPFLDEASLIWDLRQILAPFQIPDLFLPLVLQENQLKPARSELSLEAQPVYDEWKKIKPLRQWLRERPPGWKKILTLRNKQVFKIIRLEGGKRSFLYVCANSRQEIMEKLTGDFNKLFDAKDWTEIRNSTHEQSDEEAYQIIRILADDLDKGRITVLTNLDHANSEEFDPSPLSSLFSMFPWEIKNILGLVCVEGNTFEYGFCAPELFPMPKTGFGQAVFQSGVWIPEWQRLYLLRCLFSIKNQKKQFLGWKVQSLKNLKKSKDFEHPIWEMNNLEEAVLEAIMMKHRIFSKDELEKANTPAKDRLRREKFGIQIN